MARSGRSNVSIEDLPARVRAIFHEPQLRLHGVCQAQYKRDRVAAEYQCAPKR